jgi:large repetitive protein
VTGSDGKKRTWTVSALIMKSPVLPGLNADPNIVRFGDTYYLYPTTDGFEGWSGTQFKAYSSKDLVHWTDHGVILDLGPDVSWADSRAWAPTIAEKDGKYYFYFCADANIGVAVSDSPTGPFKDALDKPLLKAGQYSGQMIDPAVFTDDDGQSYLYWGNGRAYVAPLNADMTSIDTSKVKDITPSGYNEGSFVVKRKGTYYFMWSENDTRDENYRVAYATGSSPTGPWTKQGVILQKDLSLGIKGTGHHSVVYVPKTDEWYIAYHRFAIPGGDGTHRETTIDKMEFDSDGLIKNVVPTLTSIDPIVNRKPAITSATGPTSPVSVGHSVTVTAEFRDADVGDSHTCTIDWKNGSEPTAGTIDGTTCRAEHTYTKADIRRPVITVTDNDGGSDSTTLPELIVYDRAAGPAVGAGLLTSPAGAYPAKPSLTGLSAFSFGALYLKGDTTPNGNATFDFGAAKLTFRSTGSDWLVVTGDKAVYQGSGTVNGSSGYGFRITATDAPDTFRIKVWKKSTGGVVYDNTTGARITGVVLVGA